MTARDEAGEKSNVQKMHRLVSEKCPNCSSIIHIDITKEIEKLKDELLRQLYNKESLRSENERLKSATHCAYCGEEFPLDTVTADQVDEHIHRCPKHPIAVYRAEIESLRSKLAEAETQLEAWQSTFKTSQLSHAQAELESLRAKQTLKEIGGSV